MTLLPGESAREQSELWADFRSKSCTYLVDMDYHRLLTPTTERVNSGRMPVTDLLETRRATVVGIVEDQEILRHGLVSCLLTEPGIEVTVPSEDESLGEHVDIAVVSSQAASRERFPCPIVVCSHDPDGPRNVAEGNDVVGVVHRESVTVAQLHATIRAAAAGLRVGPNVEPNNHHAALDPRSLRLVELIAEGHSTREVADEMNYSEQTIKKLITRTEGRLEARSRAHMVAVAIRRGLI